MSRWKAFTIHLSVSFLIVFSLSVVLALTWYPPIYAQAVGGFDIIAILAAVDVTIGPLLTLIIWNVSKPSLRFDISVIILLQLTALGYGLYTLALARPVYIVFAVDRFNLITAVDIPAGELEKASKEFRSLPLLKPKIIAAKKPANNSERSKLLFSALTGGADLQQIPQYYRPYAELSAEAAQKAQPLDLLMQHDAETHNYISSYLSSHQINPSTVKFLPLKGMKRNLTVLVDAVNGDVKGIMDVNPWQR
jgi:hypothetical protein